MGLHELHVRSIGWVTGWHPEACLERQVAIGLGLGSLHSVLIVVQFLPATHSRTPLTAHSGSHLHRPSAIGKMNPFTPDAAVVENLLSQAQFICTRAVPSIPFDNICTDIDKAFNTYYSGRGPSTAFSLSTSPPPRAGWST